METGLITLVSVALNALVAVFAPLIARRLVSQQEKLRQAEEAMQMLGAGIRLIERAVEENKDTLARTGAGDRIARTISTYGPLAKQLVDSARSAAAKLRDEATAAYEAEVIRREHKEHAARERERTSHR